MIKTQRIYGFLLRHWYEILASMDRKVDIFFWPTIDLLTFGLLTVYIDKLQVETGVATAILGGLILWTLVYNIQRDITVSLLLFLAWNLFSLDLFSYGYIIAFFVFNIFVFGWAFGYITSSLIFRFGTRIQTIAWSLIALLYPISGVFYPLDTLPHFLVQIAKLFPVSYIFESMRSIVLEGGTPEFSILVTIVFLNLLYFLIGIFLYIVGFNHAKS